jgi:hypothetical protein
MSFDSHHLLVPHPAAPPPAGVTVAVAVMRGRGGNVALCYRIQAPDGVLRMPAPATPGPMDGLWQHSCCEAFVAGDAAPGYTEFNFSPSGQWARYVFDDYRVRASHQGMPAWRPTMTFSEDGPERILKVTLEAALLPPANGRLALACVLEDAAGGLSYWALRHPHDRPDFHHRDGFALMLDKEAAA